MKSVGFGKIFLSFQYFCKNNSEYASEMKFNISFMVQKNKILYLFSCLI